MQQISLFISIKIQIKCNSINPSRNLQNWSSEESMSCSLQLFNNPAITMPLIWLISSLSPRYITIWRYFRNMLETIKKWFSFKRNSTKSSICIFNEISLIRLTTTTPKYFDMSESSCPLHQSLWTPWSSNLLDLHLLLSSHRLYRK